jgi:hypothetical protein
MLIVIIERIELSIRCFLTHKLILISIDPIREKR